MKKYLVTIIRKQVTSMMVNGENKTDVINKVSDLMENCEKNKVSFEKIFDQNSFFKYKVELIQDKK